MEKQNESKKTNPSHSNFRKGMSDYTDGGNLTHHLGNNDYKNRTNAPAEDNLEFDGSVANGNEDIELQDEEEE